MVRLALRVRVSCNFADVTQQIHSFRASGEISSHAVIAAADARSAVRISCGKVCTTPPLNCCLFIGIRKVYTSSAPHVSNQEVHSHPPPETPPPACAAIHPMLRDIPTAAPALLQATGCRYRSLPKKKQRRVCDHPVPPYE